MGGGQHEMHRHAVAPVVSGPHVFQHVEQQRGAVAVERRHRLDRLVAAQHVPARVEGYWSWQLPIAGHQITYSSVKEQRFQAVEGVVRAGKYRELLQDIKLRGEDISFALAMTLDRLGHTRHEFTGKVRGDQIEGRAIVTLENHQKLELP